jgi:SpoVK/Ycf46/Vps4 family AAA+-type ATPase
MRTLVLLGPDFRLPAELRDVVLLDESLPDDAQLGESVSKTYESAYGNAPEKVEPQWIDAVRGLSAFEASQVFALSLRKDGVSESDLWERKRTAINQTQGLEFVLGGPTFDSLGGLDSFKEQIRRIKNRFGVIVFADEIEKQMAGTEHDSSGVSQDFHGQMLQWMQDRNYTGIIAVGPAGSGKTAAGMAIGTEMSIPTIRFDINGLKGSLVGESEQNMRRALKVIDSVAGDGGAFVFATCNSEAALSPEFKRRFWLGEWFFDLLTKEERDAAWKIHLKAFGIKDGKRPDDSQWTGAEIRNCCARADMMGCSLKEAAQYIVPIARSSAKRIEALRRAAQGNWLSASYPGAYRGVHEEQDEQQHGRREVRLAQ